VKVLIALDESPISTRAAQVAASVVRDTHRPVLAGALDRGYAGPAGQAGTSRWLEARVERPRRLVGVRDTFLLQGPPSSRWDVGRCWWGRAPGFPSDHEGSPEGRHDEGLGRAVVRNVTGAGRRGPAHVNPAHRLALSMRQRYRPPGASTSTTSPVCRPRSARPSGEFDEIRRSSKWASTASTMT
jgi:hypothetical protein